MTHKEGFCSVGMLMYALDGEQVSGELGEAGSILAKIICEQFPERVGHPPMNPGTDMYRASRIIMKFNDHPETTFEDVERCFEKAELAFDERIF